MQARQKFRIISICLLFVIQALFLVAIFVENTHSYIVLAFIGLLSLLILYSYLLSRPFIITGMNMNRLKLLFGYL